MSSLPKLTKRHEFIKVAQQGRYATAVSVIVQHLSPVDGQDMNGLRVGFTASKRVGNAVRRNRAKRRLREAIRHIVTLQKDLRGDIVLIAKPVAIDVPFSILIRDIQYCLRKCLEPKHANENLNI